MKIVADQNIPFVKECFEHLGEVHLYSGRQITPAAVADADILLVRSITKVNADLLAASSVKFAATATIGVEHIDTDYLASRKIGFASAPGSNANSVAEYVVAALLTLGKKKKVELAGKSIGVVGVGNVGSRTAAKCAALGMKVVLNDPPLARQTGDGKYRPLDELMDCDFITFHTPLTKTGQDKTFHLANEAFFKALKKGAYFINTSRGGVMDTAALKSAMRDKLSGVVLDVWENEPNIDAELLAKVDLSTPHIAGYSYDGKIAGLMMIYEAACRFMGVAPQHTIGDFLPPAQTPEIRLTADELTMPQQALIHDIVQKIYVINRDDFNTREILFQPAQEQGAFFDKLRKEYPVRREFQNTRIVMPPNASGIARQLAGIGFKVESV